MTEMIKDVLSPSMKLADLIDINYRLIGILPRFGIPLGFGDSTVESICGIHNINAHTFLLICSIYTYDNYVPTREHMEKADMRGIMRYLHNSHSYYLDYEMVTLGESIDKVTASCDDRQKDIIKRFFAEYKEEVISHFEYEEQTLFPYIESMLSGKRRKNYSIGRFEKNHSNIDEKLNDLKNIVMKYLPAGKCDAILCSYLLIHIYSLEQDLDRHTSIENNVLVPMAALYEEHEKGK